METIIMPIASASSSSLPQVRAVALASTTCNPRSSSSSSSSSALLRRQSWKTTSLSCSRRKVSSSTVIRCGGAVREINESEFANAVLKSERPVLVEFVATWCGPCRLIAPAVQALAQEYQEKLTIVKVDHDSNPKLIEKYKVYGLPTLIVFQNGQEVPESRREGAITKVKLKEYVDKFLESLSTV